MIDNQDISVCVRAVAGRSLVNFKQLNALQIGDVVQFDKKIDETIDIYANDALVAKGRVVIANDKLGIVITELIKNGVD